MRLPCFLPSSVLFHSSGQTVALEWIYLCTIVHESVHWSATIEMSY